MLDHWLDRRILAKGFWGAGIVEETGMSGGEGRPGNGGQTYLPGQGLVWKDSLLLEVLGTLDELNCHLGLARALGLPGSMDQLLERIQGELFQLGGQLSSRFGESGSASISSQHLQALETEIQQWGRGLPRIQNFILPAGSPAGCQLYLARAVCRRAERGLTSLVRQTPSGSVPPLVQAYLNRLGTLLFVLGRAANHLAGIQETIWKKTPPHPLH